MSQQTVMLADIDSLAWNKLGGLLPTVVQDHRSLQVLMLAYMSRASLEQSLETVLACFFSRSRDQLWTKGETSGHTLAVVRVVTDCDRDSLVLSVDPNGPTCHRHTKTCFDSSFGAWDSLWRIVEARAAEPLTPSSYTHKLLAAGVHKIAQKVGEEAVETALAAKDSDQGAFVGEVADLVFHLLVLLKAKGVSPTDVGEVLAARQHKPR